MDENDQNKRNSKPLRLSLKDFFTAFWKTIFVWILIVIFILVALRFNIDKTVIGGIVLVFGLITEAFLGLVGIISLLPFIGPIIAKLLALPIFWLINSLGYFASLVAIKKGYSKNVLTYRILTIIFLAGMVIGFILGRSID